MPPFFPQEKSSGTSSHTHLAAPPQSRSIVLPQKGRPVYLTCTIRSLPPARTRGVLMAGQGEEDGARFPDSMLGRKRVSRACRACRASKKRCDYMLPCSNCSKKGMAASCMAAEALGTKKPSTITVSRSGRTARGAAHEDDGGSESLENTESRSRSPPLLPARDPVASGRQSDPTEARARGASPSEVENHRMLLGSNGEKGSGPFCPSYTPCPSPVRLTVMFHHSIHRRLRGHILPPVYPEDFDKVLWPVEIHGE